MNKEQGVKDALRTVFSLQNPVETKGSVSAGLEKKIAGSKSDFELLFSEVCNITNLGKDIPVDFFECITKFYILIAEYYKVLSSEQILLLMQTFYALLAEIAFSFTEDEASYGLGVGLLMKAHESLHSLAMKKLT